MSSQPEDRVDGSRRDFLRDGIRVSGVVATGVLGGVLASQQGNASEGRWQIDPDKCIACDLCATNCVLDESAVKCIQCFDMCGYCDICTGYFSATYSATDTAAENSLCPTDAVLRTFVEEKAGQGFYEYTIVEDACIGCGKCVKGCALMNGSFYLQIQHDRCVNCNECTIALVCPSDAFVHVSNDRPYRLKKVAYDLVAQNAKDPANDAARKLLSQVEVQ